MKTTEFEAASLLCHLPNDDRWKCAGSQCMAWRWAEPVRMARAITFVCDDTTAQTEPERPAHIPSSFVFRPAEDENACWAEPDANVDIRQNMNDNMRRGYCGLAGKVEF